jgi:hypothetical protein
MYIFQAKKGKRNLTNNLASGGNIFTEFLNSELKYRSIKPSGMYNALLYIAFGKSLCTYATVRRCTVPVPTLVDITSNNFYKRTATF